MDKFPARYKVATGGPSINVWRSITHRGGTQAFIQDQEIVTVLAERNHNIHGLSTWLEIEFVDQKGQKKKGFVAAFWLKPVGDAE